MSSKNLIIRLFVLLFFFVFAFRPVNAQTIAFSPTSPYSEAIQYAYDQKITDLYSDGQFKENSPITRGELTKMLVAANEDMALVENCDPATFKDVDSTNSVFKYICTAKTNSIVSGYGDGTFKPDTIVTIPEATTLIAKAFDKNKSIQTHDLLNHISFLSDRNAIPTNLKCIDDTITRGDIAEIIYRLDNNIGNKESTNYGNLVSCPVIYTSPMIDESCRGFYISRGWSRGHTGIDFVKDSRSGTGEGCWISAVAKGTVEYTGWSSSGLGNIVIIQHPDGNKSMYAHGTTQITVKPGQKVNGGEKIMFMGRTGRATATHLHFSFARENTNIVANYGGRVNPSGIVPF